MTAASSDEAAARDRRLFLKRMATAAAIPTAAAVLGTALPGTATASERDGLPDYAAIPAGSVGPDRNADGYFAGRIKGNLYWVTDSFYQAMFLTTRDGVVLVDAPPTIGHNLLRAIQEVTRANGRPGKVTHLVYSHSHADHIGASSIFGRNVVRIGHTETRRLLRIAADPNRPAPTETFDDRYVLRVGGEVLELAYHGPNHSPDNIFVYAPRQATLMVVDVLYPGWVPFKGLAVSQDIPAWIKAHDVAMAYPWRTLVGGHLGRLGIRADGDLQKRYVADLEAGTRAAMAAVDPTPFFQKYGPSGNSWAVFKTYLEAVAQQAAAPVIAKYTGVLAAADVFTTDNAFAMLESLRIDAGELGPFGTRP
ncbi:MBL fold metallo-hydrolase [Streptomyces graminilatus]|uniref:MBL fold metallo-hydrolase n=1 Tax=Streptomyces graminilatus TaxID=1464070 RepID=UPI0006E170A8|nr:MBL fold metallo-hydrolase [Streptomyces graminilatus]